MKPTRHCPMRHYMVKLLLLIFLVRCTISQGLALQNFDKTPFSQELVSRLKPLSTQLDEIGKEELKHLMGEAQQGPDHSGLFNVLYTDRTWIPLMCTYLTVGAALLGAPIRVIPIGVGVGIATQLVANYFCDNYVREWEKGLRARVTKFVLDTQARTGVALDFGVIAPAAKGDKLEDLLAGHRRTAAGTKDPLRAALEDPLRDLNRSDRPSR